MYVLLDADLTLKETASREYDFVNYCCKERMKDKKEKNSLTGRNEQAWKRMRYSRVSKNNE